MQILVTICNTKLYLSFKRATEDFSSLQPYFGLSVQPNIYTKNDSNTWSETPTVTYCGFSTHWQRVTEYFVGAIFTQI